jgi:hypothetical protein
MSISVGNTFKSLKEKVLNDFSKQTYNFVVAQYPEWKQFSDHTDINFWSSWILTKSIDNWSRTDLEKNIYDNVSDYLAGNKTWDDVLGSYADDDDHIYDWNGQKVKEIMAWEQLGKSAVRQGWLQLVKTIYHQQEIKLLNATTKDELQYSIVNPGSKTELVGIYPFMPKIG